ncbi:phage/plasmid primase, P4 family [Streptomyces sp. NPDC001268]|uniref:phage/plasmid primase, P4 family n=1 Tax=Streptomyces sp. NPDC001268 TaxID=3364553 RepID=UPI00368A37D4
MTNNNVLDAALAWHHAGASVVRAAVDGTKRPDGAWKQYQTERPTEDTVRRWFEDGHPALGIITGAISSGLELIEFEGRAVAEAVHTQFDEIAHASGLGEVWERIKNGYCEVTPSGGYHLIYRVTGGPVQPNTKLARRPSTEAELEAAPGARVQVLVETRGEGGFVITAPSHGPTHPSGQPWQLLTGSPKSVAEVSAAERDALFTIARMLDQIPAIEEAVPARPEAAPSSGSDIGGTKPGEDYEQRTDWADILTPRGWRLLGQHGNTRYWQRPGKTGIGPSATTGHADDRDRLYVFTTSTEFDSERPYTKFGAYALLEHGGDHSAAAKELRRQGYGSSTPTGRPQLRIVNGFTQPLSGPPPVDGANALQADTQPRAHVSSDSWPESFTDDGNALLFVDTYGEHLRYVPQRGMWLTWEGHRWAWDEGGLVIERARDMIRTLDPFTLADEADQKRAHKHKATSLSRASLNAAVQLARSDQRVVAPAAKLDATSTHLNTPDGIVDLVTGEVRPSDPAAMHTRSTAVAPDFEADAPRWRTFLADTFGEDTELASFVQRLAGYSASGDTRFHVLPFLHGPGGNGKTVFLDVLRILLGDYAATAPNTFLMVGQQQHETEVARLAGLRLVVVSEVNQDARFDEAKMKLLTGGDALTARFMRQDHFTFEPTHHLWLMGNHLPAVKAGGDSFWRRLRLVPFTRTVPEERKIDGLARILADEEGPAILAWMIRGAVDAFAAKLREPAAVMAFTESYAEEEDSLARFMEDCCHLGGGTHVTTMTSKLRGAYEDWCKTEGEIPLKPQVLGRELRTRFGIEQKRSNGRRMYVGVALVANDADGEER